MRLKPRDWAVSLGLVMLGGLLLRLYGINFGLPGLYDPDEMMFELGAIRMLSHATLNPGWFGHPATTTMYVLAITNVSVFGVGHLMGWFPTLSSFGLAVYTNPAWMILPGRVVMALFGAGTIWQTGQLGRELFDRRIGLIAAVLVAVSPQCVAWAQVIRSDIMGSFFILLALRAALRAGESAEWRRDGVVAAWLGVAVATKWPMGLAALGMGGMLLRWALMRGTGPVKLGIRLARFGAMVVAFTLLTSPYLLLAYGTVVRNLHGEVQLHHLGATGGTPLFNLGWYLGGPLANGLSWTGLVLAGAGLVLVWRRADRRAVWLVWPVVAGLGVVICGQRLVWDRWVLPLIPLLAILAAAAIAALADWLSLRLAHGVKPRLSRAVAARAIVALAMMGTAFPMGLFDIGQARGRMNDTRQRASAWAGAHIPAGATVLIEHFGFDLYSRPWRILFPLAEAGCIDARAMLQGKAGYNVIDSARGSRSNIDFGTMPQAQRQSCHMDFAIITQFDRYSAEATSFPQEYQAYRALIAQGRVVASFFPRSGQSAGPIVRIVDFRRAPSDHPHEIREF